MHVGAGFVASLTPFQYFGGIGGLNLRSATGGVANGMPKKVMIGFCKTVEANPRRVPSIVFT